MITEPMLDRLREQIRTKLSPKRFFHTAEVEKMVARLAALYIPEKEMKLRAAALLHDMTKELSPESQMAICLTRDIGYEEADRYSPKTLHARTAAALIPEQYPDFADTEIIGCVRWHTTGHADMTLCEQLVYLADYIDMSRTFEDCVQLRNFFFDAQPGEMDMPARLSHLRDTLILSFDMTFRGLLEEGKPVSPDSVLARNQLLYRKFSEEK